MGGAARFDLVIAGGEVVMPDAVRRLDVGVRGEKIEALGAPGTLDRAGAVIDAAGKIVFPGVIDAHVHCCVRSHHVDDLPTTLVAAARGGVTTAVIHLLPTAGIPQGPLDLLDEFQALGEREGIIDFSFHAWLPERAGTLEEVPTLVQRGVPSFKLFLAYKSIGRMASDAHLLATMETVAARGGLLLVHAEDGEVLDRRIATQRARGRVGPMDFRWTHPDEAEWLAIEKALYYGKLAGCPLYIVHVSTPRGAELITTAREHGQTVWAETCPQYLELTDEELERWGPLAKISPPLRDAAANAGLWSHMGAGRLDLVGSDHSPHSRETKSAGERDIFAAWYGAPGVQTLLPVMWDAFQRHGLPLHLLARVLAERPARILGLASKGAIAPGLDADLVLIDPCAERQIRNEAQVGHSGYTLYHGRRVRGWPVMSLLRGQVLMEGDHLRRAAGGGRFVARQTAPISSDDPDRTCSAAAPRADTA